MMDTPFVEDRKPLLRAVCVLALLVLLTASLAVLQSIHEVLWADEMFELQTDSVASLSKLVEIQRTIPISLDPLLYHALAHGTMKVLGPSSFWLRFPSLLGYLLMQVCLFLFVRRWFLDKQVGYRAGIVAAAFPVLTTTSMYAVNGRPYGLLLGLVGVVLVAWQACSRFDDDIVGDATESVSGGVARFWMLLLLTISVALTLNTHYYGVLVLIPLCGAELVRTLERRRVDWPMLASIAGGMSGIAFVVPFARAAAGFRQNYYDLNVVSVRTVTQTYRMLFIDYAKYGPGTQRCVVGLFVFVGLIGLWSLIRRIRERTQSLILPNAEVTFAGVLVGLPFASFLLAKFLTNTIEPRHSLPAIEGFAIVIALALAPVLRKKVASRCLIVLIFIVIVVGGFRHLRSYDRAGKELLALYASNAELKTAIVNTPTQRLYLQDLGAFDLANYYTSDPWIRSRMTLVESRDEELRWDRHDTTSLTAEHMRGFTGFTILSYEEWKQLPGDKAMVLFHNGWEWTDEALKEDGAQIRPIGKFWGGDAVVVAVKK